MDGACSDAAQTMPRRWERCYGPRLVARLPKGDAARLAAVLTGFLLVASVPVALAADTSGLRSQAAGLRATTSSLDARADAAALELYALETQLSRARAATAALAARSDAVARDHAAARRQLAVAQQVQKASNGRLATLLRTLYEQSGQTDPLAIVLGATSLEAALTGLENLDRAAGETQRIVEQARTSRARLAKLAARLSAREAELDGLAVAADARAVELAGALAERRSFVAGLRRQQGLNAARIASIEAQASAAEARTQAAVLSAPVPETAPAELAAPIAVLSAPTTGARTLTVSATGYALRGRTATGMQTAPGVVAVDPSVIPLGTRMTIPGYGTGIAADTGGAVRGNVIDLWFPTTAQALAWGRRTVTITLR